MRIGHARDAASQKRAEGATTPPTVLPSMTANDSTPLSTKEAPDESTDIEPTRRQFLAGAAAVAAARWEDEDYDPANVDGWEPIVGAGYVTGEFDVGPALGGITTEYFDIEFGRDELAAVDIVAGYDRDGVTLTIEANGDGPVRQGVLADLSPDDARELAGALYQAAWEYDNNEVADD